MAEVVIYWSKFNESKLTAKNIAILNKELKPQFQLNSKKDTVSQHISFYAKMMLRDILEKDFSIKNALSTFEKDIHGKPQIEYDLNFNISHSKDVISIAVCEKASVGIDIQEIKSFSKGVAQKLFHHIESDQYLQSTDQSQYFFDTWSKKEACVKATGRGIKTGLSSFSVTESKVILDNKELHLREIQILKGFSSAVAVNDLISNIIVKEHKQEM